MEPNCVRRRKKREVLRHLSSEKKILKSKRESRRLKTFDQSGITAVFMDPEHGGYLVGPKNLAALA